MGKQGNHQKVLIIALALAASACGNQNSMSSRHGSKQHLNSDNYSMDSGSIIPSSSGQTGLRASYACSGQKNVKPDYDWNLDGTGTYELCPHPSNLQKIAIFAPYPNRPRVCVFPAEAVAKDKVYVKPGLDLLPMYRCGQTDELGAEIEFVDVDFNAVFVVAEADRMQMQSCLALGDAYSCPKNWSYGQFR